MERYGRASEENLNWQIRPFLLDFHLSLWCSIRREILSRIPLMPRKRVRKPDPIQQNLGLKWIPCNVLARMKKETARNHNVCPVAVLFGQDSIAEELAPVENRIRDAHVPTHFRRRTFDYPEIASDEFEFDCKVLREFICVADRSSTAS